MFLTLAPLLLATCMKPPPLRTGPGKEFTLVPGQVAEVDGEDIAIEFARVVVDSRRPEAGSSAWTGEVSCLVVMTGLGASSRPRRGLLTQSGPAGPPAMRMFDGREIVFDIERHAQPGQGFAAGQYRLRMTVLRRSKTACVG